ncbi:MAG: hypothetical protein WAX89_02755, partial [Alphaproteobacteria bacterium]
LNGADGQLYAAKNGQVYVYDTAVWSDDGVPYTARWWTAWLNVGTFKRWANKAVTVVTEQGLPVAMTLQRYKNYNSLNHVETVTTANVAASYWDAAAWDAGLWDNGAPEPDRERDSFVADVFSYALECSDGAGELTVLGMKIEGVREQ